MGMQVNAEVILRLLDDVAGTSSRTEKERLLSAAIGNELVQRVMKAAYDPFVTYGLTPERVAGEGEFDLENKYTWEMLHDLSTRALTGNMARVCVADVMRTSTSATAEILWRILSKDMRAGFTANTLNRIKPGFIPVFEVMLSHKYEPKRIKKWPVAVEPKLDGLRTICMVQNGEAKFYSRTGKEFQALAHLGPRVVEWLNSVVYQLTMNMSQPSPKSAYLSWFGYDYLPPAPLEKLSFVLEGEAIGGGFAETSGAVRRKSEEAAGVEYHVFDCIPYAVFTGVTSWRQPQIERRRFLSHCAAHLPTSSPIRLVPREIANSHEEVIAIYERYRDTPLAAYLARDIDPEKRLEKFEALKAVIGDHPLEGAIVKPLDGLYEKKRSYAWLKMKASETEDLRVIGAFEGEGKYAGKLGGLIVDRNGVEVRVGGGFSDAQRVEMWNNPSAYIGRLAEVEYHEVIQDSGSLRHPRFVRWRDDKDREAAE